MILADNGIAMYPMSNLTNSSAAGALLEVTNNNNSNTRNILFILAGKLDMICTPIIILVGLIGNSMTIVIFMSPSLRSASCSMYLSSRACSDLSFLLSLSVVWLDTIGASLLHNSVICHGVVYITYVSSFLSAWLVVLVTFENFVRIRFPYRVSVYCTLYKARCYVLVFVMIAFFLYAFTLGTVEVDKKLGCIARQNRALLMIVITYIDAIVALMFPSVVIFILVFTTCHRVIVRVSNIQSQLPTISCRLQTQVIRLLFAVSAAFLVLNVPSYVVKIHYIISTTIFHKRGTYLQYFIQTIFNLLFYCGFSVNILIYFAFGRNFRKVCVAVLSKRYCRTCRSKPKTSDSGDLEISEYPTVVGELGVIDNDNLTNRLSSSSTRLTSLV